jgi:hypothetical protein
MTALARIDGAGSLMEQAELLARSNLVPKAFRGKPADVVVAMLLGQELGLGPMATMSMVDVIEGNATLNAEGKVCLVRKAGHSVSGEALATKAVARGRRSDTGDEMAVEWTLQMAQRAGLAGKAVWKQYPEAMLWSRAVSQLCRMLFPDVLAGLSYTPEEVEAFTGIESTTPFGSTTATAIATERPALPPADPSTGEVISTTTRRPPPNTADVGPCRHCDFAGTRSDVRAHLIAAHGYVPDSSGKAHPPPAPTPAPESTATPLADNGSHDESPGAGPPRSATPLASDTGAGEPQGAPVGPAPVPSDGPSQAQLRKLAVLFRKLGVESDDRHRYVSSLLGIPVIGSLNDLTKRQTSEAIDALEAEAAEVERLQKEAAAMEKEAGDG